jgi:hypothetical protein
MVEDAAEETVKKSRGIADGLLSYAKNNPWSTATGAGALALTGAAGTSIYNSPSIPNQAAVSPGKDTPASATPPKDTAQALQYNAPALMAPEMMKSFTKGLQDNTPRATALPTQSVAQRQQYMDADRPANTGMDAFNEAMNAAGNAAHGNGFAGVLGAGVAMKLGAMKASAGMADQSRYQKWVSAINENVARRNTEAMSQAQQNNAMALDRAQLMQGSERLRVESANARNTLGAGLLNTAAYADQNAINLAGKQYDTSYTQQKDADATAVAAAQQRSRNAWANAAVGASDGDLARVVVGANISGNKTAALPSGSTMDALAAQQQEYANNAAAYIPTYPQY